jgi:hypothetical protein
VIDQIDPDVIIPVHMMRREWFEKNVEGVVRVQEGERMEF